MKRNNEYQKHPIKSAPCCAATTATDRYTTVRTIDSLGAESA